MPYQIAPVYEKLRAKAFAFKDPQAPAGFPSGVIVEMGHEDGVVTLMTLSDGSVELILSNGRATVGAGQHPPTARAAMRLGAAAKHFAPDMKAAADTNLPRPGDVKIYVLIDGGVRSISGKQDEFLENKLPQAPLFHEARNVLATISVSRPPT